MWGVRVMFALAATVYVASTGSADDDRNVLGRNTSGAIGSDTADDAGDAAVSDGARGRYAFYRDMELVRGAAGTRRIFGGAAAELESFPWVVALLDRYWAARCSGAAVASHWVLTAAHCVTSRLAYVKYNTRRPASPDGDFTPVHYLYRHPKFEVVQTAGEAADVTLLHHDVGLVRTRDAMRLRAPLPDDLRVAMRRYDPVNLADEEVQVLGFGRTERSVLGEELFGARLRLARCAQAQWLHCVCGIARGSARGVCSGDSGGPVLYRDVQVGVTSMGPVECAHARGLPAEGATSVFTSLYQYADVVNATIADTEAALRMLRVGRAPRTAPRTALLLLLPSALLLPATHSYTGNRFL
ncbi:kallikrein-2-like [Epargyreus clarus]|uniref:kallikrein-2-like n=1 Tax=Epargyreus clarus TaxID=520877 RepID=UPI003C2C5009